MVPVSGVMVVYLWDVLLPRIWIDYDVQFRREEGSSRCEARGRNKGVGSLKREERIMVLLGFLWGIFGQVGIRYGLRFVMVVAQALNLRSAKALCLAALFRR